MLYRVTFASVGSIVCVVQVRFSYSSFFQNLVPGAKYFLYEKFLIVWKIAFITLSDLP